MVELCLLTKNCNVTFYGNTKVIFSDNIAQDGGGVVYSEGYSEISYDINSTVTFSGNEARIGGAVHSTSHSLISVKGNTVVIYKGNIAREAGAAVISFLNCKILFEAVLFIDNEWWSNTL